VAASRWVIPFLDKVALACAKSESLVCRGNMSGDLQFSQPVQDHFCSPMQFLQRTDDLAARLGCYLRDLPAKIGISERSMFGYRAGKYPVTAKALRKLEAAERLAGISPPGQAAAAENAGSSGNPKNPDAVPGKKFLVDSTLFPDSTPEDLESTRQELAQMASRVAALQARLVPAITAPFTLAELEARMRAAGAWPASAEDRKLSPGTLWQKYAPPL
jgi:hypothetical protein